MCRLYGFRASAPTRLDCALLRAQNALLAQSRKDGRGQANADGWGIAWYEAGRPRVAKCDEAAFDDARFAETAERVTSETVLAHVRKATIGGRGEANTHPFTLGVWTFAHNGTLTACEALAPRLEEEMGPGLRDRRLGSTDSELIFLWLLGRMARCGIALDRPAADRRELARVFREAVATLAQRNAAAAPTTPARLNLLLTDGLTLLASRWGNTLFVRRCLNAQACGICESLHIAGPPSAAYRSVTIASEPLTREGWEEVAERSVLVVGGGGLEVEGVGI